MRVLHLADAIEIDHRVAAEAALDMGSEARLLLELGDRAELEVIRKERRIDRLVRRRRGDVEAPDAASGKAYNDRRHQPPPRNRPPRNRSSRPRPIYTAGSPPAMKFCMRSHCRSGRSMSPGAMGPGCHAAR